MSESVYVEVTRKWPLPRQYEMYVVTVRVPIIDGKVMEVEPRIVLSAARYAAARAHEAWGEYKAEHEDINRPGGDFETASEKARREGAEQGREAADSPKPEPAGAGDGAGAEDPRPPLATSQQLAVLEDRKDRDSSVGGFVKTFLKRHGVTVEGQLTAEQMQDLHARLNRGEHRRTA